MDSSSSQEQTLTIKIRKSKSKSKKKKVIRNEVNDGIVVNECRTTSAVIDEVSADPALLAIINQNINDPWENTNFKGYVHMDPKQKGEYGEIFVGGVAERRGLKVQKAPTSTAGYDRIINGIKTEIKFSLAQKDKKNNGVKNDTFIINHVAEKKDWERLIFLGINFNLKHKFIWFTKEEFQEHLKAPDCCFRKQQSGKNGGNDDYICGGKNLEMLLTKSFVKHGLEGW